MRRLITLTPSPDEPRFAMILDRWVGRLRPPLEARRIHGRSAALDRRRRPDRRGRPSHRCWPGAIIATPPPPGPPCWTASTAKACRWPIPPRFCAGTPAKTYLAELEAAGAPIIPTLFADRVTPTILTEAHARFGPEIIVKPQVSGGSHATVRHTDGAPLVDGPDGPAMLQPFLPAITGEGEISLLYFGGVFSHAVAKIARADDFRVQFQHGGRYQAITPPPEALAAGAAVLKAAGRDLAYARIDLLRGEDGMLRLMELECIEPDLYLVPGAGRRPGFMRRRWRRLCMCNWMGP